MAEWMPVGPGRWVRRTDKPGEWESKRVGSIRGTVERNLEFQKLTRAKPGALEAPGVGRMDAAYPPDVEQEMLHKCGMDPDKQKLFLRDHPEFLVRPRRQADIPSKKTYIFPHSRRR